MHKRGGILSPLGTGVLVLWRGGRGGRIKTVFSVTSLCYKMYNLQTQKLQWNQGRAGQIFNFAVSVYRMFPQIKKHKGNYEKKKIKGAACQLLFSRLEWCIFLRALSGKPHLKA